MTKKNNNITDRQRITPVIILFVILIYGMIIRPLVFNQISLPLELVFVFSATATIAYLLWIGIEWGNIQDSIGDKTKEALPAIHMLFSIGLLVASWVLSGTIPMFVYYGLKLINPNYLYVIALVISALFSILTGTSWGSAGTIGVVLISIGQAVDANLAILAAAIISGCYFGDKQSPISDTTIMAAMGAGVDVMDHVQAMLYTTGPSFIIAGIIYFVIGVMNPIKSIDTTTFVAPIMNSLTEVFNFNLLLIIPPLIILIGSLMRKPSLVVVILSSIVSCVLAIFLQNFTFQDVINGLAYGVTPEMVDWVNAMPESVEIIITRGGLTSMENAVTITVMVFIYIGSIDTVDSMETIVNKLFGNVNSRSGTILATLFSSALINGSTSNQYATAMIVGNAFKNNYDEYGIPRKVLSRSIEDYGTMIEPMLPWTTTGIYMVSTLGVAYAAYVPFMFMNFINFIIAPTLAITGKGCFYHEVDEDFDFKEV